MQQPYGRISTWSYFIDEGTEVLKDEVTFLRFLSYLVHLHLEFRLVWIQSPSFNSELYKNQSVKMDFRKADNLPNLDCKLF